jgi:hypothetical protein
MRIKLRYPKLAIQWRRHNKKYKHPVKGIDDDDQC